MAKVWFSRWPPVVGHKIGQIAKIKKNLGVLPKGILTPSFIEIAAAVTKRALLTDECLGVKFGQQFGSYRNSGTFLKNGTSGSEVVHKATESLNYGMFPNSPTFRISETYGYLRSWITKD
jgi:hypothetical protein